MECKCFIVTYNVFNCCVCCEFVRGTITFYIPYDGGSNQKTEWTQFAFIVSVLCLYVHRILYCITVSVSLCEVLFVGSPQVSHYPTRDTQLPICNASH